MSELKAIRSGEIYNIIEYEDCYRTDDLYYPKSEADAFIAEQEMAEACAAISAGDKDHAKQELAQVCAVAIRMMHRLDVNG